MLGAIRSVVCLALLLFTIDDIVACLTAPLLPDRIQSFNAILKRANDLCTCKPPLVTPYAELDYQTQEFERILEEIEDDDQITARVLYPMRNITMLHPPAKELASRVLKIIPRILPLLQIPMGNILIELVPSNEDTH